MAGKDVEKKKASEMSEDVQYGRMASDDQLRSIKSFDDALALASELYDGEVHSITEELGNGFTVLSTEDKDRLINVPFIIIGTRFNQGKEGEFVTIALTTKSGEKYIINDGSTGIFRQLAGDPSAGEPGLVERTGRPGGWYVPCGLRRSDYEVEVDGKVRSATTYYLDTSEA